MTRERTLLEATALHRAQLQQIEERVCRAHCMGVGVGWGGRLGVLDGVGGGWWLLVVVVVVVVVGSRFFACVCISEKTALTRSPPPFYLRKLP